MNDRANDTHGENPMQELKEQLKSDARRHSNKLVKKISQVVKLPDIAADSIDQEVLYATLDGYRTTMKLTRNGEMQNDTEENSGNH